MRLLLDTVTFVWAVDAPERLSRAAQRALAGEQTIRELSTISLAEIAIKQARGKLIFSKEDVAKGLEELQVRVLPYTAEHAFALFDLPQRHPDPFDRQIIAQALSEGIAVATPDEAFGQYERLKILW